MAYRGPIRQWDLFWMDLDPAVGSEQAGDRRPGIVVGSDQVIADSRAIGIVTVIPVTKVAGKTRRIFPYEVRLSAGTGGLALDSIAMPQQIRTISYLRLIEKIGHLEDVGIQAEIEDALLVVLGIEMD
ncbi:MAG TPA: type II toxin-antitoxin system PemK/MazF family toxin [Longimicrobiaceae bacterium]|nr:type II toxin-antitoxin system PemK/MazF family toxin [Longimicrobiaceae bacterium]